MKIVFLESRYLTGTFFISLLGGDRVLVDFWRIFGRFCKIVGIFVLDGRFLEDVWKMFGRFWARNVGRKLEILMPNIPTLPYYPLYAHI